MKALEAAVRGIEKDGLVWGASKLVAVGYGIKKLQINLIIEDDKVGLGDLEEEIQEFEDFVQSTDIVSSHSHALRQKQTDNILGCYAKAVERYLVFLMHVRPCLQFSSIHDSASRFLLVVWWVKLCVDDEMNQPYDLMIIMAGNRNGMPKS